MPLVYATETTDAELIDQAQRTAPHGYVLKPADPRHLGLVLRAALGATARGPGRSTGDGSRRRRTPSRMELGGPQGACSTHERRGHRRRRPGRFVAVNAAARALSDTYDPMNPEGWGGALRGLPGGRAHTVPAGGLPLTAAIRGRSTGDALVRLRARSATTEKEDLWLNASGYPLLDADGRCMGGAVVLRNVTAPAEQSQKARRLEAELHERVQVLDAIIRSMGDGVVVADAQMRFSVFNRVPSASFGVGATDRPPTNGRTCTACSTPTR